MPVNRPRRMLIVSLRSPRPAVGVAVCRAADASQVRRRGVRLREAA